MTRRISVRRYRQIEAGLRFFLQQNQGAYERFVRATLSLAGDARTDVPYDELIDALGGSPVYRYEEVPGRYLERQIFEAYNLPEDRELRRISLCLMLIGIMLDGAIDTID